MEQKGVRQPPVSTWWVICLPDGQGATTQQRAVWQPGGSARVPIRNETEEAGKAESKSLVLKMLMR